MSKYDVNVQKLFDTASAPGELISEISDKPAPEVKDTPIDTLPYPGSHCLRGMDISMDCDSTTCRERREVRELQWIDCYNKATEGFQDGTHSKSSLWNDWSSSNILPYVFGISLLLAIVLGLYVTDVAHIYSD